MNIKQIRGQLRQIAKELLPELLTEELKSSLYSGLVKVVEVRLKVIEDDVKKTMNEINQRSQDAQDYLVRHVKEPFPTAMMPADTNKT